MDFVVRDPVFKKNKLPGVNKQFILPVVLISFLTIGIGITTYLSQQRTPEPPKALESITPSIIPLSASTLTCGLNWYAIPPTTHSFSVQGNPVSITAGYSSTFGGVGVSLKLTNPGYPSVNILEGRSAAGAGWQFSGMTNTHLINQAAGNAKGSQWGYSSALQIQQTSPQQATLTATDWSPNYADSKGGVGTSPCDNTADLFDEGQPSVIAQTQSVSSGSVITVDSTYTLRALVSRTWGYYVPVHAFYVNRRIAHDAGLRLYIIGKSGWVSDPINIYEPFVINPAYAERVDNEAWSQPAWRFSSNVQALLYVYNIHGLDIGVLVRNNAYGSHIRMEATAYCNDINNYDCGSIAFFNNHPSMASNITFNQGDQRSYTWNYVIGTLPQLEEYGQFSLNQVNQAQGKTAIATDNPTGAVYAVDGLMTTNWNSGRTVPPDTSITVDLGGSYSLNQIKLHVEQLPAGTTYHTLQVASADQLYTTVSTFNRETTKGDILAKIFDPLRSSVRYIRVITSQSPSWVAWREIQAFGILTCPTPQNVNLTSSCTVNGDVKLTCSWDAVPGAIQYRGQIDDESLFSEPWLRNTLSDSTSRSVTGVTPAQNYYCRARVTQNSVVCATPGPWSQIDNDIPLTCASPTPTPSPSPTKSPSPTPTKSPSPSPTKAPSPTPTPSPSYTINDLRTLIINFLTVYDVNYYPPSNNKVNILDAGWVIRWLN